MPKISLQSTLRNITAFVVLMLWLLVSPVTAFFWSLFLIWAVFRLDSRIIGVGAITLLIIIPIVLSTDLYEWRAEQLAVYVFFLLCITVTLQILELWRDKDVDDEPEVKEEPAAQIKTVKRTLLDDELSK